MDIDRQRRMLQLLINFIEVENISPHFYSLRLKWKDPVATHWDCALIALRSSTKVIEWTEDERRLLRDIYPTALFSGLSIAFPAKSGMAIRLKSAEFQEKRDSRTGLVEVGCDVVQ